MKKAKTVDPIKRKVFGLKMRFMFTWVVMFGIGLFLYGLYFNGEYNPIYTASGIMFILFGVINSIGFEKKYNLTKKDFRWFSRNLRSIITFRGRVPYEESEK